MSTALLERPVDRAELYEDALDRMARCVVTRPDYVQPWGWDRHATGDLLIPSATTIVAAYGGPRITLDPGMNAGIDPKADVVNIPHPRFFDSPALFHRVLFHELTHSTEGPTRTGRIVPIFSQHSDAYAREELIAETGSVLLCAVAGILDETLWSSASYWLSWFEGIRENRGGRAEWERCTRLAKQSTDLILSGRFPHQPISDAELLQHWSGISPAW